MYPDGFSLHTQPDPESDLAYLLQNGIPGDPEILGVLLRRYASDLYRLALALERPDGSPKLDPKYGYAQRPFERTCQTLLYAVRHLDEFWGRQGVREWLYGLLLAQIAGRRGRRRLQQDFSAQTSRPLPSNVDFPSTTPASQNPSSHSRELEAFLALPAAPHLAALLHYGHDLGLESTAAVLEVPLEQVQAALSVARRQLLPAFGLRLEEGCIGWTYEERPPAERLQAHLDGRLEASDPYAAAAVRAHLNECAACRQAWDTWHRLEKRLAERLHAAWPGLTAEQRRQLESLTRLKLVAEPRSRLRLNWKMLTWAGLFGVALLAVGLVFNSIKFDDPPPVRSIDLPALPNLSAPTPTPLPTPIYGSRPRRPNRNSTIAGPNVVWSGEPDITADGHFLVFTSNANYWVEGDNNKLVDIFLYDTQSGQIERINQPQRDSESNDYSRSPTISGDSRYIAYESGPINLPRDNKDSPSCLLTAQSTGSGFACADILLFDRLAGTTIRITRPSDDAGLMGMTTYGPLLSADGSTLLFSAVGAAPAGLTADTPPSLCPPQRDGDPPNQPCTDLYAYSIPEGTLERIPIGRLWENNGSPSISLSPSISDDGRYITLSLLSSDLVAPRLGLLNDSEAFLYDRQTGEFTALDRAPSAYLPPDGKSYNAVVSGDGAYAVFVSEATNLLPGDPNNLPDLYRRDLKSGDLELVSVSNQDGEADGPSGVYPFYLDQPAQIGISENGWVAAFISSATNLAPGVTPDELCWQGQNIISCSGLYLRDIIHGETRLVAPSSTDMILGDVRLSADGRWIAYSNSNTDCQGGYPYQICGDLWLYDDFSGEARSLSQIVAQGLPSVQARQDLQDALASSYANLSSPMELPSLSDKLQTIPKAHTGRISALSVSPDGKLLATGGQDSRVLLWDTSSLKVVDELTGYQGNLSSVRFSQDGAWLATASRDGTINIWRTDDLAKNTPNRAYYTLRYAQVGAVRALDLAPKGNWLVVGSGEGLWIWAQKDKRYTFHNELSLPGLDVQAVAFSPVVLPDDQALLAASLNDGTVLLYELPSGKVIARLGDHERMVDVLAFSPLGDILATGGRDGLLDVWQMPLPGQEQPIQFLKSFQHDDWVTGAAFAPDGRHLVTSSFDDSLRYIDIQNGQVIRQTDERTKDILDLAVDKNGDRLYAGDVDGTLLVINALNVKQAHGFAITDTARLDQPPSAMGMVSGIPYLESLPENRAASLAWRYAYNHSLSDLQVSSGRYAFVPSQLPAGVFFEGAYLPQKEEEFLTLYYRVEHNGVASGILLFRQGPKYGEITQEKISPNTPVTPVSINVSPDFGLMNAIDLQGELVRGDWLGVGKGTDSAGNPITYWTWEPGRPALHLRWIMGETGLALDYFSLLSVTGGDLETQDLLQIASSVSNLTSLAESQPVNVPYQVRAGDTCDSLAASLGTTVKRLIEINPLAGVDLKQQGCGELPVGSEFILPVKPVLYNTLDLDCDGSDEQLMLLPNPHEGQMGFLLRTRNAAGLYEDHTLVRFQDTTRQVLRAPQLVQPPGLCRWLVALQVDDDSRHTPLLQLYGWDGQHFAALLQGAGELVGMDSSGAGGSLEAHTRWTLRTTPVTCTLFETTYAWNSGRFDWQNTTETDLPECPPPVPGHPGILQNPQQETSSSAQGTFYAAPNLDCQGPEEQIRLLPQVALDPGKLGGFMIENQDAVGNFREAVHYDLNTARASWLGYPRLFQGGESLTPLAQGDPDSCWTLIAVQLLPQGEQVTHTRLLRWSSGGLQVLLDAPGELLTAISPQDGLPLAVYLNGYLRDASGECTRQAMRYVWEDGRLVLDVSPYQVVKRCAPPQQS